jgi:hypothetical protein
MLERLGVLIVAENASMRQGGESSLAMHWFLELLKEVSRLIYLCMSVQSPNSINC